MNDDQRTARQIRNDLELARTLLNWISHSMATVTAQTTQSPSERRTRARIATLTTRTVQDLQELLRLTNGHHDDHQN